MVCHALKMDSCLPCLKRFWQKLIFKKNRWIKVNKYMNKKNIHMKKGTQTKKTTKNLHVLKKRKIKSTLNLYE